MLSIIIKISINIIISTFLNACNISWVIYIICRKLREFDVKIKSMECGQWTIFASVLNPIIIIPTPIS